jgi:hypothetical protein
MHIYQLILALQYLLSESHGVSLSLATSDECWPCFVVLTVIAGTVATCCMCLLQLILLCRHCITIARQNGPHGLKIKSSLKWRIA